jgi:hypothetical protein
MPRIFDMARIRKREEAKEAARNRTDFPGSDEREAVLLGTADAWPEPDLAEVITVNGALKTVSGLTSGECTTASVALMKSVVELARKLRVKLENYIPAAPLKAEDFTAENRPLSRELNGYCLTLRAVRRQKEILEAATAALARKERDRTLLAKQRLIDEAPAALSRISKTMANLEESAARVSQLMEDIRITTSAVEMLEYAHRLRKVAEMAGVRNLPAVPEIPEGFDPVPAQRFAKMVGVLPYKVSEKDWGTLTEGRAAIARDAKE